MRTLPGKLKYPEIHIKFHHATHRSPSKTPHFGLIPKLTNQCKNFGQAGRPAGTKKPVPWRRISEECFDLTGLPLPPWFPACVGELVLRCAGGVADLRGSGTGRHLFPGGGVIILVTVVCRGACATICVEHPLIGDISGTCGPDDCGDSICTRVIGFNLPGGDGDVRADCVGDLKTGVGDFGGLHRPGADDAPSSTSPLSDACPGKAAAEGLGGFPRLGGDCTGEICVSLCPPFSMGTAI